MAEVQPDPNKPLRVVGRYALYGKLATGGMATVHFGRLLGPVGFSRTVAIKRLHPQFAKDPDFHAMFLDEARLAARIQHPNVVATVDVVALETELFLVMDYVRGESFSRLLRAALRKGISIPAGFISSVVSGMLHGLHAAHEATDERGVPLKVVHRDVSPQNVLVGVDGVARVLDFGVAKAAARMQVTREGQMKGKLSYMSPEQLQGGQVDRRSDVFAAGVVLWEALTGERLFTGSDATEILTKIISHPTPPPSAYNPHVPAQVDALVLRALEKAPDARYATAREFAIAVERTIPPMSAREVGEWVEAIAGDSLEQRETAVAEIESISAVGHLSAFNDSDPQMLRTLVDNWNGQDSARTLPDGLPAFLRDEAPTRVFRPSERIEPMPIDDPTLVFHNTEELTQPGKRTKRAAGANPFAAAPDGVRRKWLFAGAGAGAILLLIILLLARSEQQELPAPVPSVVYSAAVAPSEVAPVAAAPVSPPPRPVAPVRATQDVEDLRTTIVPNAEKKRPKPAPRPKSVGAPKPSPASPCSRPWFIDEQGIRRIKPECI